jgi:hypothetical protein
VPEGSVAAAVPEGSTVSRQGVLCCVSSAVRRPLALPEERSCRRLRVAAKAVAAGLDWGPPLVRRPGPRPNGRTLPLSEPGGTDVPTEEVDCAATPHVAMGRLATGPRCSVPTCPSEERHASSQPHQCAARRCRVRGPPPEGGAFPVTLDVAVERPAAGCFDDGPAPSEDGRPSPQRVPTAARHRAECSYLHKRRGHSRRRASPRCACSEKPNPRHNRALMDDDATVPVTPADKTRRNEIGSEDSTMYYLRGRQRAA